MSANGSYLLSPLVASADGSRTSACPVCLGVAIVPPPGGWVNVRCTACGTDFVATDGSSPPPPAPKPARSPIAPTESLPPLEPTEHARGFTSEVRILADGKRLVTCPQCRHTEVEVPRRATVAIMMRCPQCHGTFLVGLRAAPEGR